MRALQRLNQPREQVLNRGGRLLGCSGLCALRGLCRHALARLGWLSTLWPGVRLWLSACGQHRVEPLVALGLARAPLVSLKYGKGLPAAGEGVPSWVERAVVQGRAGGSGQASRSREA